MDGGTRCGIVGGFDGEAERLVVAEEEELVDGGRGLDDEGKGLDGGRGLNGGRGLDDGRGLDNGALTPLRFGALGGRKLMVEKDKPTK